MSIDFIETASAPKRNIGAVDVFANLLVTTLLVPLPVGHQVSESAPPLKAAVYAQQQHNYLTLIPAATPPPILPGFLLSAPSVKAQPQVDLYPNTLVRGINPSPAVLQLSASAPSTKFEPHFDIFPNYLLGIPTIGVPLPLAAVRLDTSAPRAPSDNLGFLAVSVIASPVLPAPFLPVDVSPIQVKYAVWADEPQKNLLTLIINPDPQAQILTASAPAVKYTPQVDVYENLSIQIVQDPAVLSITASAPFVKYQPQVDTYPNRSLPIALPPQVQSLTASAPITRYAVELDSYVNNALGIPVPPVTTMRVQAAVAGWYREIFRDPGDVFDINTVDFSNSAVSFVPVGNPDYPLYGWMTAVPSNTPLYSFALSNGGASSIVIGVYSQNSQGVTNLSIRRYVA